MILENNATFTQMYIVFYSNPSQNFYILKDCMEVISRLFWLSYSQQYNDTTIRHSKFWVTGVFVSFFVFSKML